MAKRNFLKALDEDVEVIDEVIRTAWSHGNDSELPANVKFKFTHMKLDKLMSADKLSPFRLIGALLWKHAKPTLSVEERKSFEDDPLDPSKTLMELMSIIKK